MSNIQIIGLCSHIENDKISGALNFLERAGHKVTVAEQVFKKEAYSAGTIQNKLDALHNAFSDDAIDFILCSVGGNGAVHLLNKIDYDLIRKNPKPLCGFSDVTSILNAIYQRAGIITYHGPTATQLHRGLPDNQTNQFIDLLNGNLSPIIMPDINVKNAQSVTGRFIGGNLSVFQTLLGTRHLPEIDNSILFFEDIGDEISRYDRMLAHIKNTGLFEKASAILFGNFQSNDSGRRLLFQKTMDDIIDDLTSDLNIPIVTNCPFGHRGNLWTFPIGQKCHLEFDGNAKTATVSF